jgi:DNA-binding SARP family transcriptional activator
MTPPGPTPPAPPTDDGGRSSTRLRLLGGFELRVDEHVVVLQPVAQRLMALLALAAGSVERSFVAFRLWPDTAEERAKANLRSTVWRLRRSSGDVVEATKTHMRLAPWVWVDVCNGVGDRAATGAARTEAPRDAGAAFDGELLPDWYDDWLVSEREQLRQLGLHDLERRGAELLAGGRTDEAIQVGLRACALEPLRESPHRLVIRCHLAEGNVVEAVRQYARYAGLIEDELGVPPSPQIRALVAETGVGLDGPMARSAASRLPLPTGP